MLKCLTISKLKKNNKKDLCTTQVIMHITQTNGCFKSAFSVSEHVLEVLSEQFANKSLQIPIYQLGLLIYASGTAWGFDQTGHWLGHIISQTPFTGLCYILFLTEYNTFKKKIKLEKNILFSYRFTIFKTMCKTNRIEV